MPQNITEKDLKKMIRRYNAGQATDAEKAFVDAFYDHSDSNPVAADEAIGQEMKARIMGHVAGSQRRIIKLRPIYRYVAAACLFMLIGAGLYFISHTHDVKRSLVVLKNDIRPGGNHAILTLSNGQKVVLGSQAGKIASQGNTTIALTASGQISYTGANGQTGIQYNTLTVPIGNHRDITLADGTEVSLDAGSSLIFPVAFNGTERSVKLTGQGYFKVKHNAAQPFLVQVNNLSVRDIGTEFNISAYDDESAVKTTLFEGSVKVNETLLSPGEQASATPNDIQVRQADLDAVGAWRNNDFVFRNQSLRATMRQIARWYNVTIVYEHAPEDLRIRAAISRNRNISAVLQLIQETGKVKFKVEGRTVTISE
jgi:ferric-dicitrate binding protein FerR (iron transport regulator)